MVKVAPQARWRLGDQRESFRRLFTSHAAVPHSTSFPSVPGLGKSKCAKPVPTYHFSLKSPLGYPVSQGYDSREAPKSSVIKITFFFFLFRAEPAAYGSSQVRGQIGAAAASLHHSHSNMGSETCL